MKQQYSGQMAVAQLAMKFYALYGTHKYTVVIHNNPLLHKRSVANIMVLPFSLLFLIIS